MRKGKSEALSGTMDYTQQTLDELERTGYKFFQIKGLTIDRHYDYTEPYYILLVPIKALPEEQGRKDIYEPINSDIFQKWLKENNEYPKVLVAVVDK
jgi:hypothetical protein